jgi:hypothetical protein
MGERRLATLISNLLDAFLIWRDFAVSSELLSCRLYQLDGRWLTWRVKSAISGAGPCCTGK